MFTGLVAATGELVEVRKSGQEMHLLVDLGEQAEGLRIGDSIALAGVCCTVTELRDQQAAFVLTPETLRRSWFSDLKKGSKVNLEKPLRAGDPFGGHVVQGHVDGVAQVVTPVDPQQGGEFWLELPLDLLRYCVVKGSISLDGVSLTIAALRGQRCMVALIPHTAVETTLGRARAGDHLNVEVDILGKYVERLLEFRS